jgi:hypothetical protein
MTTTLLQADPTEDIRLVTSPTGGQAKGALAAVGPAVGPAAVAVLRFVLPYNTSDKASDMVAKAYAQPGRQSLVLWLALVATLTLAPAVVWVARMTRGAAPKLTRAALLLLVPGYLAIAWNAITDGVLWAGVHEHIDPATVTRIVAASHPAMGIAGTIFVAGHVVGTVLIGIALWRCRAIPRWAAVATVVAQPLHVVAAVALASHSLDFAAWGLNAIGFAAAGWALTHSEVTA